ncbi:hypothetical protein ACLKA7_006638 [Drosophila subpalustris]
MPMSNAEANQTEPHRTVDTFRSLLQVVIAAQGVGSAYMDLCMCIISTIQLEYVISLGTAAVAQLRLPLRLLIRRVERQGQCTQQRQLATG